LDGQVVIRPMMCLALTYDHRIIDGREAVTLLVQVKEFIGNPELDLVGLASLEYFRVDTFPPIKALTERTALTT
jgi:hypothetical protein